MAWARIECSFPRNPMVLAVSPAARCLYVNALCYAREHLTDGDLGLASLSRPGDVAVAWGAGLRYVRPLVRELLAVGLFEEADGRLRIHDYLEYNQAAAQIRAEQAAGRERAARSKERRASPEASPQLRPELRRSFASPIQSSPENLEPRTTLSSADARPHASSSGEGASGQDSFQAQAREVLEYLNGLASRSYRPVAANLGHIAARLRSGASVEDCKRVVDDRVASWLRDPKMTKFLRPETLFRASKFEGYLGALGSASINGHAPGRTQSDLTSRAQAFLREQESAQ